MSVPSWLLCSAVLNQHGPSIVPSTNVYTTRMHANIYTYKPISTPRFPQSHLGAGDLSNIQTNVLGLSFSLLSSYLLISGEWELVDE